MSGSEAKTLPATPSKEIVTAMVTLTAFITLFLSAPILFDRFADALRMAALLEDQPLAAALRTLAPRLAWISLEGLGPLLVLLAAVAALTGVVSNGGLVFAAHPILPKLERLDPIKGLGRLFKLRNLVELLKNLLKLAVVLTTCALLVWDALNALMQQPACGMQCVPGVLRAVFLPLLIACCGIFLILGLLDIGVQQWLFRREMRMTRSEHKRERKDAEGDPLLQAQRRKERRDAGRQGTPTGLRHATFVIRSAEAALAFRYAKPDATVPVLVARAGSGNAHLMAAEARRLGVPVVFDPQAVDAVSGRVQIGKMIPQAAFPVVIQCMRTAGVL